MPVRLDSIQLITILLFVVNTISVNTVILYIHVFEAVMAHCTQQTTLVVAVTAKLNFVMVALCHAN